MGSEKDWRRLGRTSWVNLAIGILIVLFQKPLATTLSIDAEILSGVGAGLIGAALLFLIFLVRKPDHRPAQDKINRLSESAPQRNALMMLAMTVMFGAFMAIAYFDIPDPYFWVLALLGAAGLGVCLVLMPILVTELRASRVAPELHDERSQQNLDKAYRQSATLLLQICMLGGLAAMVWDWQLPMHVVLFGLGFLSTALVGLLWSWHDWREGRAQSV